ncbi:MAG: hypothetical protein AAFV07_12550, partial [Bacteroidota bacterium]
LPREAFDELEAFIQRQRSKKGRKDLELLGLLDKEPHLTGSELLLRLYPDSQNKQAYHALRKRLMRQLTDFITLRRMRTAPSTQAGVMGLITLAQHLGEHQQDRLAWDLLRKAERQAHKHDQYDLLNTIYNLQIEQVHSEFADSLEDIIQKYEKNKVLAEEEERSRLAYALIAHRLEEVRRRGKDLHFAETIKEILGQYNLQETVSRKPDMLYKLLSIARSAVVATKDYYSFEPYMLEVYGQIKQLIGQSPRYRELHARLLYLVAHVHYRNKKFRESLEFLAEMEQSLEQTEKGKWRHLRTSKILLETMCLNYLGDTELATNQLEQLLAEQEAKLATRDRINARINLCFFRYQLGDLSGALRSILDITHSDKWLEKKMGKEWVVRKCLSEVLLQYDLGNMDIAQNRIRALERNHRDLLSQPEYARVRGYLSIVKILVNPPSRLSLADLYTQTREKFDFLPMEQEDLQEVNYYAWLKATLLKRPYREILVELVNRREVLSVEGDRPASPITPAD